MTHLVMTMEQGRSSIRAVSTQEYAEMKAVRSPNPAAVISPAKAQAPQPSDMLVKGLLGLG